MSQQVKLPAMLASYMSAGSSPGCSSCNPVPCKCANKAAKDGQSAWAPATHVGYLDGVPGSFWLWSLLLRPFGK